MAQTAPPAPVFEAAIYDGSLLYRTLPGAQLRFELLDAAGEAKDSSAAVADESGEVRAGFGSFFLASGDVAVIRLGGPPTIFEPGDTLRVAQAGAPTREIEIPDLTADIDVAADRIAGTGPAGATLQLEYGLAEATKSTEVIVDAQGRWSLDLAAPGEDPLPPGSRGSAGWTSPENYRFSARFGSFDATVGIGAGSLSGQASPGTEISLTVDTADGQTLEYGPAMAMGDSAWSLQLGGGGGNGPVGPGPGPGQGQPAHRIAPGDRLTFHQSGGPMAADRSWSLTVPAIELSIDAQANSASGVGPADAELLIRAESVWGELASRRLMTDADGSFRADFAETAKLGPGWRVSASWAAEPALRVAHTQVISIVQAGIYTDGVSGLAAPGSTLTVTLKTLAGELRSRQVTQAGLDGSYRVQHSTPGGGGFFAGPGLTSVPGNRLEVEMAAGDPLVFSLPEMTAVVDVISDTLRGTALPGSRIRMSLDSVPGGASYWATADDAGAYLFDLQGLEDLAPGSLGSITVIEPRGHAYVTSWAAPRLSAQLGQSSLGGTAAVGRSLLARLLAPDGSILAEAEAVPSDFGDFPGDPGLLQGMMGSFFVDFVDVAGQPVMAQSGDSLLLISGDNEATLVLPQLDGTVFVESDLVTGRTEAGREVTVSAAPFGGGRRSARVIADETGAFSHGFEGQPDLRYNDAVGLGLTQAGHSVGRAITVPGLSLDLDASRLAGSLWPNTRFMLEARRGGTLLARSDGVSTAGGEFSTSLQDGSGEPLVLEEGDRLDLIPITRQAGAPLAMTVPELKITADPATDVVGGLATPGGELVVLARNADSVFALSQSWPTIAADGSWKADFIPGWDVAPGTAIVAQYRLPEGHLATRSHIVPLLRAEIGGPNVCGFATSGRAIHADLLEGGSTLASVGTKARFDGRFQAAFTGAGGALLTSQGGQSVAADLGGVAAEVALPPLELSVDWQARRMSGKGPASTRFMVGMPARRCLEGEALDGGFQLGLLARTGPDGSFQAGLPLPIGPGEGFEITFIQPDGHQAYAQAWRALAQAYIGTDRVAGQSNSGAQVALELRDPNGDPRGWAEGLAGADGHFDLRLRDAAGEPVAIQANDFLGLEAGGDQAEILILPLDFDWSPGDPIVGTAPPSIEILLQLKLMDGRVLDIPRSVSGNGQWGFTAAEVPRRSSWNLDDVEAVRALLVTPAAHEIIFETEGFASEGPQPKPPLGGIFLPWLGRSAS
jgi:hypothetical protein